MIGLDRPETGTQWFDRLISGFGDPKFVWQ
jgi:hypothetical protein